MIPRATPFRTWRLPQLMFFMHKRSALGGITAFMWMVLLTGTAAGQSDPPSARTPVQPQAGRDSIRSAQPAAAGASGSPDILATVDGVPITREDFEKRYELTIFPYKDAKRLTDVVRRQFLYSLIAEKLLASRARAEHVEVEQNFRRSRALAEEMLVRDKLYHDEVRSKITVNSKEIRARYDERRHETEFQFLYSESEEECRGFSRLLASGVPFDTLLAARQTAGAPTDTGRTEAVERSLAHVMAALKPGAVSAPVRAGTGWYILRRADLRRSIASEEDFDRSARTIENEIRREREAAATVAFVRSLWKGRKAVFVTPVYRAIGQRLMIEARIMAAADTSDFLVLRSEVYDSLRYSSGLDQAAPAVSIGGDTLSTGDFIDRLEARGVRIEKADIRRFPALFERAARDVVDWWMIAREGYRRGLDRSDDVRRDMEMWMESGLAQALPDVRWERFIASDDSLWNYFARYPSLAAVLPEVRIVEVLTRDPARMDDVVRRFNAGEALHDLAAEYSERPDATEKRGESAWFRVSERGLIGRTAFGMNIADHAGPLQTPDGLSFFQLVDKRYPKDAPPLRTMSDLRRHFEQRLQSGIRTRTTEDDVIALARKARITVNESALARTATTSMQMFTVRFLGFGGRMPAAPAVMPLFEAVMEGLSTKNVAQP